MESPAVNKGFVHSNAGHGLIVSVCLFCSHIIAAKADSEPLEIAERSHLCAERWLDETEENWEH